MPRPRTPDVEHVPPTPEEIEADLDVFCTACQVAWSPAFADRRAGLCVNHMRGRYRDEHVRRGLRGDLHTLTAAEVQDALEAQDGKCPVCKTTIVTGPAATAIADYDGVSRRLRGFTCLRCRKALRLLNESPERATALATYLSKKPSGRSSRLDVAAIMKLLVAMDDQGAPRPTIQYELQSNARGAVAVFKPAAVLPVIESLMATQATPRAERSRVVSELRAKDTISYDELHALIGQLLIGSALAVT